MDFPKATITGMNGKQFTEYLTPFKDDAYCIFELTNAGISDDYQHRIMQKVADEYGCKFSDDELLNNEPTALLQAMLAIYAWIEFKDWLYYDQIEEKRGIMHDKGGITMTKEEYKEKLNKLLGDMDTLDDAYGYYDNDEFDFDYIMQLHDIADDALDLAEEAEDVFDRD